MKTSELGVMWATDAARKMRYHAMVMRRAYRTPLMTAQTYPIADAYDQAAKLFDGVAEELSNRANGPEPISPPMKAVEPQPRDERFDG